MILRVLRNRARHASLSRCVHEIDSAARCGVHRELQSRIVRIALLGAVLGDREWSGSGLGSDLPRVRRARHGRHYRLYERAYSSGRMKSRAGGSLC